MRRIRARSYRTKFERSELWRRWKSGESTREIGAAVGCDSGTVSWHVRYYGGIEPPARIRAKGQLTLAEREELCDLLEKTLQACRGVHPSQGRTVVR